MVNKRRRTRKQPSPISAEDVSQSPPSKRYSLRKRNASTKNVDFEYFSLQYVDDEEKDLEAEISKESTDDEEFQLEQDEDFVETKAVTKVRNRTRGNKTKTKASSRKTRVKIPESEPVEVVSGSELVDFEDMIQADIVVNHKYIDYDNLIQKTEIKLEMSSPKKENQTSPKKVSKRVKRIKKGKANGKKTASEEPKEDPPENEEKMDTNTVTVDKENCVET